MATTIPWSEHEVTEVHRAYSGPEALQTLSIHPVHILVTDIRMPGMSGLELIEQTRRLYPHIDCILLTGYAEFPYAKRAIELQAASYLIKPVRDEELLQTVRSITERQKARLREQSYLERLQNELEQQLPLLKTELLAAQARAERSAREERGRIARDIHDIVGHTLTTTLVQIEAAKRLIARDRPEGLERLEQSQQLVRKSLDDIREAVRRMNRPDGQADLESELRRFAAEAERTADIAVECAIELPEPVTDPLLREVVGRALQEGITNGIRHGRADRFRLRLVCREGALQFALWNNGLPFDGSAMGFGLNAMRESVRQLGGSCRLAADREDGGSELLLSVPLQPNRTTQTGV